MSGFKVGDKVICTDSGWGLGGDSKGELFVLLPIEKATRYADYEERDFAVVDSRDPDHRNGINASMCMRHATRDEIINQVCWGIEHSRSHLNNDKTLLLL